MKVAYEQEWLRPLFAANSRAQLAFGPEWMTVVTLTALIESYLNLAGLTTVPGLSVLLITTAGALGYFVIRLGEVELLVQPVDDLGRVIAAADDARAAAATRLLLLQLAVRGTAIERVQTA